MSSSRPSPPSRRAVRYAALGGALLWLALAMTFANRTGFATDEGHHLAAALAMLHAGDFRMNPEHPPLVKSLAGVPVMLVAPPNFNPAPPTLAQTLEIAWRRSDPWVFVHELIFLVDDVPWHRRLFLARLAPILIGLLGGWLAFVWGRHISRRPEGGLLAAGLLLFYPEYMGHASFLTFDVPLLAACAAMSGAAWQWWRRPSARRGAVFLLVSAVAVQVKLPATFFLAFLGAIMLALSLADRRRVGPGRVLVLGAAMMIVWWAAAWASSGFRFAATNPAIPAEGGIRFMPPVAGENLSLLLRGCNFLWEHRLLPETTISQLIHLSTFEERTYVLFGQERTQGWLHYFLVTFALKTPWPLLAGVPILAWRGWRLLRARGRLTRRWRLARAAILGGSFTLLFVLIAFSRINIGHRHVMFIYFPLCVGLGAELMRWWQRGAKSPARRIFGLAPAQLAVAAFAGGQALSLLFAWPNLSTYFNVIGWSPYHASRWVGDSNCDWGQDDALILDRLEERGWSAANLCLYITNYPPEFYGLTDYRWFNPRRKPPFTHKRWDEIDPALPTVISVNELASIRASFPGLFDREPDEVWNSQVLFYPSTLPATRFGHSLNQ